MLIIGVRITNPDGTLFRQYTMDHDDPAQRKVLGEQCRNAFEAGQSVSTSPKERAKAEPHAGVICPAHGHVDIDRDNYVWQMSRPSSRWVCPKCGSVSDFDDDRFEELNPEPEEN